MSTKNLSSKQSLPEGFPVTNISMIEELQEQYLFDMVKLLNNRADEAWQIDNAVLHSGNAHAANEIMKMRRQREELDTLRKKYSKAILKIENLEKLIKKLDPTYEPKK